MILNYFTLSLTFCFSSRPYTAAEYNEAQPSDTLDDQFSDNYNRYEKPLQRSYTTYPARAEEHHRDDTSQNKEFDLPGNIHPQHYHRKSAGKCTCINRKDGGYF